ncbi:MAG: glycosyltransferase, partial [Planctomycetota bacterium]
MTPLPAPAAPVRVLHISGRSDHGGGPEHIAQVIAAGTAELEHHVACPENGVYWERYRNQVGSDRLCPLPHRRVGLRALARLCSFVRAKNIQVIHSHGMSGGVYGRLVGMLCRRPVIHSFHGIPITPGLKHRVYQLAEHALSLATDHGVAVSAGEADIVRGRWNRYRSRLVVVPNGINFGIKPEWASWPPRDVLRIVSFTRRNRQKNP